MNKQEVIDLIKDTGFGCLATTEETDEGIQPRNRPMMPYLTDEGNLLLAVLQRVRTIPQIKKNPWVEMCYIDRKMWYARVKGKAKVSENLENKQLIFNNIPMLRQYFSGPEDPNFVLIEIETVSVEAMAPHQKEPEIVDIKT